MSAIIEIDGYEATIDQWTCDDEAILAKLQALESPTYPGRRQRYAAAAELEGKVICAEPEEPETDQDGRQFIY